MRALAADSVALKLLAGRLLATLGHPPDPPPADARLWGLLDEECPPAATLDGELSTLDARRSTLNAERSTFNINVQRETLNAQVPHPAWPGSGDLAEMLRGLAGGDPAVRAERQRLLRLRWRELRRSGG